MIARELAIAAGGDNPHSAICQKDPFTCAFFGKEMIWYMHARQWPEVFRQPLCETPLHHEGLPE
jgi:hypothetical protein